ncbi:MAG: 2-dehydro-3-deoxygalactonokinase [Geminicoccaceae bacterium]|nr:2-dehydro-3-deoxygalactonokinase [Geminicoccaceae bacterium]
MPEAAALMGIDWGTTSFRAYLLDRQGDILERREAPAGILQVADRAFEDVLISEVGPWLERDRVPVIASGMITSRQGWVETPYLPCPAGAGNLADALVGYSAGDSEILFVPGLKVEDERGVPDVIRGEETQIAGLADSGGELDVVLPGTHSKWARVQDHRITTFRTFMTGELYGVLRTHSILGRLMEADDHDPEAFARGVDIAGEAGEGLLRKLFGVRTLGLFDRLPATATGAYLSGLLIGTEIAEAIGQRRFERPVLVAGERRLAARYLEVLARRGVAAEPAPDDLAGRGQWTIARHAGLVG